jgi:hypothetical protein
VLADGGFFVLLSSIPLGFSSQRRNRSPAFPSAGRERRDRASAFAPRFSGRSVSRPERDAVRRFQANASAALPTRGAERRRMRGGEQKQQTRPHFIIGVTFAPLPAREGYAARTNPSSPPAAELPHQGEAKEPSRTSFASKLIVFSNQTAGRYVSLRPPL